MTDFKRSFNVFQKVQRKTLYIKQMKKRRMRQNFQVSIVKNFKSLTIKNYYPESKWICRDHKNCRKDVMVFRPSINLLLQKNLKKKVRIRVKVLIPKTFKMILLASVKQGKMTISIQIYSNLKLLIKRVIKIKDHQCWITSSKIIKAQLLLIVIVYNHTCQD